MSILSKVRTVYRDPKVLFQKLLYTFSPFLSDETYLKLLFRSKVGYKLNLDNPTTFNEKLQWLKVNYRKPILTRLVDKYSVKDYVKELGGSDYVAKTFGVWDKFDDINFELLPEQFVLKTTHDYAGVLLCDKKENFSISEARKKLKCHLNRNPYYIFKEWPYKNVKPRIIAEEYLTDGENTGLTDYKFFCFDGIPKIVLVATERQTGAVKINYFDIDFRPLDIQQTFKQSEKAIKKPKNYENMVQLAVTLSTGFPFVRIDFYNIDGTIIFGEFTFFPKGGLFPFHPSKWDEILGNWLDLEKINY